MRPPHRLGILALALTLPLVAPAFPAEADTLIQPLSGARNLAQGGGWLAWAQPGELGRWRLAVRSPGGVTTTPAIANFGAPPDPNIGSDRFGISGRRLFVVYSRCAGASSVAGCDIYRYDVAAGTEAKVTAISTVGASETAPAVRSGVWSFVRRGAGVSKSRRVRVHTAWRRAAYVAGDCARDRSQRQPHRLRLPLPVGQQGGGVAVRRLSGEGGVVVATADVTSVPWSLVGTRYKFGWLRRSAAGGVSVIWTSRLSGRTSWSRSGPGSATSLPRPTASRRTTACPTSTSTRPGSPR